MKKYFIVSLSVLVVVLLSGVANAASIIGTNMSTTGTFTQTIGSATAARFQDAAGNINVLVVDSVNTRVGVGAAPGTTFEVQGTASASYFLTGNTIQVGGFASVAYNRFGTSATTHASNITTTNDVLVNGDFEVDSKAFFDGTASVASDFEVTGYSSASQGFFTTDLIVNGRVASSSSIYVAEFGGGAATATVSVLFGSSSASSKGTCFQFKDDAGTWVYARVLAGGTSFTINNIKCHN